MKECIKGYNCGNSCIEKKDDCVINLSEVSGASAALLRAKIEAFNTQAALAEHAKVTKSTLKEAGVTKEQTDAVHSYTRASRRIRRREAGLDVDDGNLDNHIKNINDFLANPGVPAFGRPIYSGFKDDMAQAYSLDSLRVGSEFSFPSMTSFSSDLKMAKSFNGGGRFVVKNNKSGKSIDALSSFVGVELEVLVPNKAKYRVANVTKEKSPYGNLVNVYELQEI